MAALICDICGGKLKVGYGGVVVCESCGMEYTKERIREMTQGVGSESLSFDSYNPDTVAYDVEENSIGKWRTIASEDFDNGNYDEAYNYYLKILETEPNDYDATWHKAFCLGWDATVDEPKVSIVVGGIIDAIGKLYSGHNVTETEEYEQITGMVLMYDEWSLAVQKLAFNYVFPEEDEDYDITVSMARQYYNTIQDIALGFKGVLKSIPESYYLTMSEDRLTDFFEYINDLYDDYEGHMNFDVFISDYDYYVQNGELRTLSATSKQRSAIGDLKQCISDIESRKHQFEEKIAERREKKRAAFFSGHIDEKKQYVEIKKLIEEIDSKLHSYDDKMSKLDISLKVVNERKLELSNKIDALKREVSILSHKIFGRKKALEEAAIKKQYIDEYNNALLELDKDCKQKAFDIRKNESARESARQEKETLENDLNNMLSDWGIQ